MDLYFWIAFTCMKSHTWSPALALIKPTRRLITRQRKRANLAMSMLWKPGMGAPPRGEGGVPRPAPHCGEGGVPHPDPPRKNDQNRGEVAGQNKGLYLNFLQKRKLMMEQYHNTEHE